MSELRLGHRIHDEASFMRWLRSGEAAESTAVTSLSLWDAKLTDTSIAALATHPAMGSIHTLDLSWNRIGPEGAQALAAGLPQLTSLRLYHNDLGEAGAAIVADAPWRLTSLNLCGNGIGPAGMAHLSAGSAVRQLRSLHLGHVGLGDDGVAALLRGRWPALVELNVRSNAITGEGAARITAADLPRLQRLGLDDNPIDDDGLRAIASGPGWARLTWLNLGGTDLGPDAVDALRGAASANLAELRVQATEADPVALEALLPGCTIVS